MGCLSVWIVYLQSELQLCEYAMLDRLASVLDIWLAGLGISFL